MSVLCFSFIDLWTTLLDTKTRRKLNHPFQILKAGLDSPKCKLKSEYWKIAFNLQWAQTNPQFPPHLPELWSSLIPSTQAVQENVWTVMPNTGYKLLPLLDKSFLFYISQTLCFYCKIMRTVQENLNSTDTLSPFTACTECASGDSGSLLSG